MQTSIIIVSLYLSHLVESSIYLSNTQDGSSVEFYDCFSLKSLQYCRRPTYPINLTRTHASLSCHGRQAGIQHRFSDLKTNITTVLHQWRSSLEQVEAFARFSHDPNPTQSDQYLCQCQSERVFGKYCEYELPTGTTLEQTLDWQVKMRNENEWKVQMYGNITRYEGIQCNASLLGLDWREICDGTQNCMNGVDEDNCDILELNRCLDDEYRCSNGMCIPEEYFVDGERDCLDWTDEMEEWMRDRSCPKEKVSVECDDHICLRNQWACGDGQCVHPYRFHLHQNDQEILCLNRRDQYFMCESDYHTAMWTMANGRCNGDRNYLADPPINGTEEEKCEYLLKCVLSRGIAQNCPCRQSRVTCDEVFRRNCSLETIQYPKGPFLAPFLFFNYSTKQQSVSLSPSRILARGTVTCRHSPITRNASIISSLYGTLNDILNRIFCTVDISTDRHPSNSSIDQCFRANESTDICQEWNPCMSVTRIRDGWPDCQNLEDEIHPVKLVIDQSCATVQRHRFRCSINESTCLNVRILGDDHKDCQNGNDELWHSTNRQLIDMKCNTQIKTDCSLLRQYINQSWSSMNDNNDTETDVSISFRSYCDTFFDFKSSEDEHLQLCQQDWRCTSTQYRCERTGQCIDATWIDDQDREWDCVGASDEQKFLVSMAKQIQEQVVAHPSSPIDGASLVFESCHQDSSFICLSPHSRDIRQWHCLNQSQLDDRTIDCLGAIDERNTLGHCASSSSTSLLGNNFVCTSTNTCISFFEHCGGDKRCPNTTDDTAWCPDPKIRSGCDRSVDFLCFNKTCIEGGRCNKNLDCLFGEDEYMCDYTSIRIEVLVSYRWEKRSAVRDRRQLVDLPVLPNDVSISQLNATEITTSPATSNIQSESPSLSLTSYSCNRGIGVLSYNDSIVCFCPPQYYGAYCQYHADRILLLFHLNLDQSIYTNFTHSNIVIKLLVVFLFEDDQVLMTFAFHVRPAFDASKIIKKMFSFPYSRSSRFRQHRQDRHDNRTDLIHSHPYSIRIEAYEMDDTGRVSLIAVWQYPIIFDFLPVFRLAKVLHLTRTDQWTTNPCSSQPCPVNADCFPLMNDRHRYVCLCKADFTGKNCTRRDEQCKAGFCAKKSLCKGNYRSLLRGHAFPYCVCPADRYGDRCDIVHDYCQWHNPCRHGGSCYATSEPNRVFCMCTDEYRGKNCEMKKTEVRLSIVDSVSFQGMTIQYFNIDYVSLELILDFRQVLDQLPKSIRHIHNYATVPEIIIAKIYQSSDETPADLHLLAVAQNASSIDGATSISEQNHCKHIRQISTVSSPIQYHGLCISNDRLMCFYDDVYFCICGRNHGHVECFVYDNRQDECSNCLSGGRCLRGHHTEASDFLCICPSCYSGRRCQFNWNPFAFTLDQLVYTDLISSGKERTITLLLIFAIIGFLFSIPNNLFSHVTLRRRVCLRNGVGHYLLYLSIINQISLSVFLIRLIHLIINIIDGTMPSLIDEIFCRVLSYLLTCSARLVYWLSSLIAIERVYMTVLINGQWLRKPSIARRLIFLSIILVLICNSYELVFYKVFHDPTDARRSYCVFEYPRHSQSFWSTVHIVNMIVQSLVPFFINLCSAIVISVIVVKNKMNTLQKSATNESRWINFRRRCRLALDVLRENKELVIGPTITLIPLSFSLPWIIASFVFNCQNIQNGWIRYLLVVSYYATLTPQWTSFFLYIIPSSFYLGEWKKTELARWIYTRLRWHSSLPATTFTILSNTQKG